MTLDDTDKKILRMIQVDGNISLNNLAEAVNLTTTPCWKRIKRLEDNSVIKRRVALLDPDAVGLSFTAFVMLKTTNHSHQWYKTFVDTVIDYPEVMEFYRMAGEYDYMLRVLVKDMKSFDEFYKKLVNRIKGLSDVTSTFAMESLKYTTELPF